MNKEFCMKCGKEVPECAVVKLLRKFSIEDLIDGKNLVYQECLVCHKNAQTIGDKLLINEKCSECCLCQLTCPKVQKNWNLTVCESLEPIVLKHYEKLAILIKALYPKKVIGSEVQVKGNYRAKRIDVVVKTKDIVYLIKVLPNIDKVPLYSRSYEEVKQYYDKIMDIKIITRCLVPKHKKEQALALGYLVVTLDELINELGEI